MCDQNTMKLLSGSFSYRFSLLFIHDLLWEFPAYPRCSVQHLTDAIPARVVSQKMRVLHQNSLSTTTTTEYLVTCKTYMCLFKKPCKNLWKSVYITWKHLLISNSKFNKFDGWSYILQTELPFRKFILKN